MKDQIQERNEGTSAETEPSQISRRTFLKVAMTSAGLVTLGVACSPTETAQQERGTLPNPAIPPVPEAVQFPEVPETPLEPPAVDILNFFTLHEARTVEAITARILPGTPDDPGAREARVVVYIDKLLSYSQGFAQPIYRLPPYAETYEGDSPPESETSETYTVIWVKKDQLERYGYQSALNAREIYRVGLESLDAYANALFGADFIDLSEAQQDQIVGAMAEDRGSGSGGSDSISTFFSEPSAKDFFEMLRDHTIQGMFCDPVYGGNREMVGWKLIGYPGAQRAYTEQDLHTEAIQREPQSIAQLSHFHPGRPSEALSIIPVSGFTEQDRVVDTEKGYLQRLFDGESEN